MKKADIRKYIKEKKRSLTTEYSAEAAHLAFEKLENIELFKQAKNVLLYHSLPDEISTLAFLDKWSKKKRIYLPRVNGDDLDILPYQKETLQQGAYNIEEPSGNNLIDIKDIDLIIVPGVAFDEQCNRVGRGKGYYDRLLSDSQAKKIGIAYDFQIVENIEIETHDIPVDIVVTDKHTYQR